MSKSNVVVALSQSTVARIKGWSGKASVASMGLSGVVDGLVGDGITPDMLKAAKGAKEDSPLIASVKAAIVSGFTPAVQMLLKKDTKSLSDAKKIDKRYWQQQIGSRQGDIRKALARRLAAAGGAGGQRSLKEIIHSEAAKRLAQVRADEKPNYDPVKLIAALAEVMKQTAE